MSHPHFTKGDQVEVTKPHQGPTGPYFPATVIRAPAKHKTQMLVQYQTLLSTENGPESPKPVLEYVDWANVRPVPPKELNQCFKIGDNVDAFRENSWVEGTVMDIYENSRYLVLFEEEGEEFEIDQWNLRLHRKWEDGSWVPPLPQQEKPSEMAVKSRVVKLISKTYSRRTSGAKFRKGTMVEVSSDGEGYKGSWFIATIIESIGNDNFLVEYQNLTTDDGTQLLREEAHARYIRPCSPKVPAVLFKRLQKVDAWYNEGWWEGVISKAVNSSKYVVYFSHTNEELQFEHSDLRPRQDWINGKWVIAPPMEKFNLGTMVEVRSDEEGYKGSWYASIIVGLIGKNKFLVEYQTLKTEDETKLLREEADALNIRPYPPKIERLHRFKLSEKVDAWYNEGWWVGHICNVLDKMRYKVYFETSNEVLDFDHSDLRPHQEWIDGKWVAATRV